ncbi:MAG: hypothetical protein R6V58_04080 [Planctomycetota bacterium]
MPDAQTTRLTRLRGGAVDLLRDAARTSWDLFKIMVPLLLLTRVLAELGVVGALGEALGPVMQVVGLPGELGLVWATALVTNIYGAMAVFVEVAPDSITVAQVTVLSTMVLVAHALPVEGRICQKAGPRLRAIALLRIGGALLLGFLLHLIYSSAGALDQPSTAFWNPGKTDGTWPAWAASQARNLVLIFAIILLLLLLMRLLRWLGIRALLTRLLEPVLRLLGMSRDAAPVTIIGMTMGLSYGGGLIIREARSGRLGERDIFFSLALMSLCHSLIEDTLLLAALGAHHSGILWGRLGFALAAVFLLARALRRLPDAFFRRHLFRSRPAR